MAVIRKKKGNFLEDFRVGHVFYHKCGKTITEGLFSRGKGWGAAWHISNEKSP
jgi:hypothetical protein